MKQQKPLDPLFVIFEEHLYHFQDSDLDRKTFIANVVRDYLHYLRKQGILVPKTLEETITEELGSQVRVMLVKKIYGCLTLGEFAKRVDPSVRKRARARYSKLVPKRSAG